MSVDFTQRASPRTGGMCLGKTRPVRTRVVERRGRFAKSASSKTPTANHRRPLPFWTGCCGSSLRGVEWCEATNVEKQMGFECVLCLIGWGRRAERKVVQDSGLCVPPICVRTLMGREGFPQLLWRPLGEQLCRLCDILGLFGDGLEPTWGL